MATPVAKLLVSIAGGGATSGFVSAAFGQTMQLSALSTANFQSVKYEIYDYPPGMICPSGWSTAASGVFYYAPSNPTSLPPVVTLPASGSQTWGPFMLRLSGNGNPLRLNPDGSPNTGFNPSYTDESTIVFIPSPTLGLWGLGFNEETQGDALRGYVGPLMHDLRLIEAAATGGGGVTWTAQHVKYGDPPLQLLAYGIGFGDPGYGAGGVVTMLTPIGPTDGIAFKAGDSTATNNGSTRKIGISPTSGCSIEDPQNPGSFVTTTVYIVQQADFREYFWDATNAHWKLT